MAAVVLASYWTMVPAACAEDAPVKEDLEVHEWGIWFGTSAELRLNARTVFANPFPPAVSTRRVPAPTNTQFGLRSVIVQGRNGQPRITVTHSRSPAAPAESFRLPCAPVNVVTFYGNPISRVNVELQIRSGELFAHWPPAFVHKNLSSGVQTLRWYRARLLESPRHLQHVRPVVEDHWFTIARRADPALHINRSGRTERFLAYDVEPTLPIPVKVHGTAKQYTLQNTSRLTLRDVALIVPTAEGLRIGWLDELPGSDPADRLVNRASPEDTDFSTALSFTRSVRRPLGAIVEPQLALAGYSSFESEQTKSQIQRTADDVRVAEQIVRTVANAEGEPAQELDVSDPIDRVPVALSEPLPLTGPDRDAMTADELKKRLLATSLRPSQIDLLLRLYAETIFGVRNMAVVARLPRSYLDRVLPIAIKPRPARIVRVALLVLRDVDPQLKEKIDSLIVRLGDADYRKRERAEQAIAEMGRIVVPALKKSLTDDDPEVVYRAERLLNDLVGGSRPTD